MNAAPNQTATGSDTMTTITKLQADLFSTGINTLTQQEISEGFLEAGTLVKDACKIGDNMRFLASTDGGSCWCHERANADEFATAAPNASFRTINY